MKKYFSILILSTFLIPSVAFASWWNPLTWFADSPTPSTTDEQITALEQKITTLQNEINASTSVSVVASSSISATSTATTTPVVKKMVIKKVPPAIPSAPASNTVSASSSSSNSAATVQACINTVKQTSATELSQISNDEQQAYANYQNDVAELTAGTYPLTAAQQAQINTLNTQLSQAEAALSKDKAMQSAPGFVGNPSLNDYINAQNIQATITNFGNQFAATNYKIVNDQYNAYTATENEKEANVTALTEAALTSCSSGN